MLWSLWQDDSSPQGVLGLPRHESGAPGADRRAAHAPAETPSKSAISPARAEVPTDSSPAAFDHSAVLRGRAVDRQGDPLAGVEVNVVGNRPADQSEQFRIEQGRSDWQAPEPVVAGDDGRFEIRFEAAALMQFHVRCGAEGRVETRRFVGDLEPGVDRDLGDLAVVSGAEVFGIVVDASGRPVVGQSVRMKHVGDLPGGVRRSGQASTGLDGSFRCRELVVLGVHELQLPGREIIEPADRVQIEETQVELRIVVADAAEDLRPTITGKVVDELGRPVRGAEVFAVDAEPFFLGFGGRPVDGVDGQGRFELRRPDALVHESETVLSAFKEGYAVARLPAPVAWGSEDVTIRLEAGPPLEIRVRWDDGGPVESFGVVLAPERARSISSRDFAVHHHGEHPGGVLRIERVTPWTYSVHAVVAGGRTKSGGTPLVVVPGRPAAVDLVVHRVGTQEIEVVDGAGEPMADVPVELVRQVSGAEPALQMRVLDPSNARMEPTTSLSLEQVWRTDAGGRAQVEYAPIDAIALRLPGPGHAPMLFQPLPPPSDVPLRIVVPTGGTLRGRIEPAAFRAWLDEEAVEDDDGERIDVSLLGLDGMEGLRWPAALGPRHGFPVEPDGRFEIAGIPPGPWRARLTWRVPRAETDGRRAGTSGRSVPLIDRVTIREGETHEAAIDLSELLPASVGFQITVQGVARSVELRLHRDFGLLPNGEPERMFLRGQTDASGALQMRMPAGAWMVRPSVPLERVQAMLLPRQVDVAPAPGDVAGPQHFALDFAFGEQPIRVLAPDGTPVIKVQPWFVRPGSETDNGLAYVLETDAEGRTLVAGSPGLVKMRVPRRAFGDWQEWERWKQAHPDARDDQRWLEACELTLGAGRADELEIQLPAAWAELPE